MIKQKPAVILRNVIEIIPEKEGKWKIAPSGSSGDFEEAKWEFDYGRSFDEGLYAGYRHGLVVLSIYERLFPNFLALLPENNPQKPGEQILPRLVEIDEWAFPIPCSPTGLEAVKLVERICWEEIAPNNEILDQIASFVTEETTVLRMKIFERLRDYFCINVEEGEDGGISGKILKLKEAKPLPISLYKLLPWQKIKQYFEILAVLLQNSKINVNVNVNVKEMEYTLSQLVFIKRRAGYVLAELIKELAGERNSSKVKKAKEEFLVEWKTLIGDPRISRISSEVQRIM